jgi:hypothetical protein
LILAQVHHALWKGSNFAIIGFVGIIAYFTFLLHELYYLGDTAPPGYIFKPDALLVFYYYSLSVVVIGLLGRARQVYKIKGHACGEEMCNDASYDICEGLFCIPCATMRLGHHVFDYGSGCTSQHISYAPVVTTEPLASDIDDSMV